MSEAFAGIDTVRVELAGGDWAEFKAEITYAEDKVLQGYGFSVDWKGQESEHSGPNFERFLRKRLATWLIDWSFTSQGKPMPVTEDSIRALRPAYGERLNTALDAHITGVIKNALGGEEPPTSKTKSQSPTT